MKRYILMLGILCLPVTAVAGTNYDDTPMTAADLGLYLSVMHAAADHIAHAKGDDKAAIDLWHKTHGNLGSPPNDPAAAMAWYQKHGRDVELINRATDLENCDDDIAKQRGVADRYDGIKDQVEGLVMWGGTGGASCGSSDCGGTIHFTAAQIAEDKKQQAARKADWQLVKPHVAEIKVLERQVHHLGVND